MDKQKVVSREEWLAARKALWLKEKELTHAHDALNRQRRELPLVEVDKSYEFAGPQGRQSLLDLFEGRQQLIVYHFMFDPDPPPPGKAEPWSEGCSGCSHLADNIPHLAHLHARDTSFVMVSRAPFAKIEPFKRRMGWTMPWVSSFGSDFNYDFHVTLDAAHGSTEWNYATMDNYKGELPGLSVFLREGDAIYHSYSTYARGLDILLASHHLLDMTPFGRGEGWDGMPDLGGQGLNWLRHHDKYEGEQPEDKGCCH